MRIEFRNMIDDDTIVVSLNDHALPLASAQKRIAGTIPPFGVMGGNFWMVWDAARVCKKGQNRIGIRCLKRTPGIRVDIIVYAVEIVLWYGAGGAWVPSRRVTDS